MSFSDDEVIDEIDENYEEESSELEDEDELNHRIQNKSHDPANHHLHGVDPQSLKRSQTDPPGDLSQFEHEFKGGTDKHIKKKSKRKRKHNKMPKPKEIHKSKSVQQASAYKKHSYKRDDDLDDIDVESVEDGDIANEMMIREEEEYLDMNIAAEDYTNDDDDDKKAAKRGSTLDYVKNGIMSAKKRLLSPEKTPSAQGQTQSANDIDSPYSASTPNETNPYSPSTPATRDSNNSFDSEDSDRMPAADKKKKKTSHDKRSSFNILSKGKGLFNRTGSNKELMTEEEQMQHKKSGSKANLNSIKSKLQNIKKSYSKNSSSDREQSKKWKDGKAAKRNVHRLNPKDVDRHRSASTAVDSSAKRKQKKKKKKKKKNDKVEEVAEDKSKLKRHSMVPMRSRSQKPSNKKKRQSLRPSHSKQEDSSSARRRRKSKDERLDLEKKSYSEYGRRSKSRKDKQKQYDSFTMRDSMRKKSQGKLGVVADENKSRADRLRRKSGGDGLKSNRELERDRAIAAADRKCKYRVKNEIFELYEYYKPIKLIGSGAYAVVCEAIDERTKRRVAIKKNKHIFDDLRDARRILREIKLLLHFNKYQHPDLIQIYDTLPPTVSEIQDFEDVYIVMPLMESTLCKIITSAQKLNNLHFQYLTYQILRGLAFIHGAGVIHRDIKPENILLNGMDCDVKIIDFGLARGVLGDGQHDDPENAKATEYVCTRWYRSPEVMCSGGQYDEKMDIWGVGCILAEMILRRPLFPGANYLDQLQQIFDVMGTPKDIDWILNDQARNWVDKLPKHNGKNLKKMIAHRFSDNDKDLNDCADIMYKLLQLNPADRISANDALAHPYFESMHEEADIIDGDAFDLSFEFEQSIKTKFGVRHMMYTALDTYHKKQWHKIKKKKQKKRQREREKAGKSDKKHRKHKSSKHKSSKYK